MIKRDGREYRSLRNFILIKNIKKLAQKLDCSPSEIALAWLRSMASILTPICGFRTLSQFEKSISMIRLSGADLKVLNDFSPRKIVLRE